MIRWRKLIEAPWKVLRSSETSSPIEKRKLHITAAGLSTAHHQRTPVMISSRVGLTKLAGDVLREKVMTAMIPKKPKNTMGNSEVPTV
jgi:hypothetical protein